MKKFNVCAVCGKRHAETFDFRASLRDLGIDGKVAVPECVNKAQKKQDEIFKKCGIRYIKYPTITRTKSGKLRYHSKFFAGEEK